MTEKTSHQRQRLTRYDLERAGFDPSQCRQIEHLRARYHPLIEEVESNRHWHRLQLLRWLYRQGRYPWG